jgi:hypothetical protein
MPSVGDTVIMLTEDTAIVEQFGQEVGFRAARPEGATDEELSPGEEISPFPFKETKRNNPDGSFDTGTYKWTVPEDGIYIMSAGLEANDWGSGSEGSWLEVNIVLEGDSIASEQTDLGNSDGPNQHGRVSGSFQLREGDQLWVRCRNDPNAGGSIKVGGDSPDDAYWTSTKVSKIPVDASGSEV